MSRSLPVSAHGYSLQSISQRHQQDTTGSRPLEGRSSTSSSEGGIKMLGRSRRKSLALLCLIFTISAGSLYLLFRSFPELSAADKQYVRLPRSLDDAKELGRVLSLYTDTHFMHVVIGYCCTYIFLQAFAIPGSIFLSVLSGYLFPTALALFLVCLCSANGASACYILSDVILGRNVVARWFPERVELWKGKVSQYGWVDLLSSLIFLRITPFLPNWFINVASPVIGFPLSIFFIGTFIGVAPPSFLAVMSGTQLYELTSATDFLTGRAIVMIGLVAVMALLPIVFKRLLGQRLEARASQD